MHHTLKESHTSKVRFAATVTAVGTSCPACEHDDTRIFYEVKDVPTNQVLLRRTREAALNCSKGDIRLALCHSCGFIWNAAFHPELVEYGEDYESTQAVSPTFNAFHDCLAKDLMARFDLAGKEVFEIGCGQGEFLTMLCELGVKKATGFDPVLRDTSDAHPRVTFVKDWYSERYANLRPDFVCSKMVMEHIPDPGRYCRMLRATIGDRPEVIAFAMMPEVTRILELRAFWDIFYEHCAYYSLGSLARVFRRAGFHVTDLWRDFGQQYALIGARPAVTTSHKFLPQEEGLGHLATMVDSFLGRIASDQAQWQRWFREKLKDGKRVVIWGGGSKGVAFLTTLGIRDGIELAVDINPNRNATFLAGTGQQIVTPDVLNSYRPDAVIIMSPIYRDEIASTLASMELTPELVTVESFPTPSS